MTCRRSRHYGQFYGVSAWIPPRQLSDVAHERIEGMVGYFLSCAHSRDQLKWQNDLYVLARSCYLQGATDVADVAAHLRMKEQRGEGANQ
jgi:hypothetical protein